jgi:hypothetical protein
MRRSSAWNETAQTLEIAGHDVRVVTPALFIATKLEAFHGRASFSLTRAVWRGGAS